MNWSITPRRPSGYNQRRTYIVKPRGKKFVTIHFVDGSWTGTLLSKTKKQAFRKGIEHLRNYINEE